MHAKGRRITKEQRALLEKRVIAYWMQIYAGRERRKKKRTGRAADNKQNPLSEPGARQ